MMSRIILLLPKNPPIIPRAARRLLLLSVLPISLGQSDPHPLKGAIIMSGEKDELLPRWPSILVSCLQTLFIIKINAICS